MAYVDDLELWAKAAAIRALKTFAQTALSIIPMELSITQVTWGHVLGCAATAAVCSLLMSCNGIPEVSDGASVLKIMEDGNGNRPEAS